MLLQFYNYDSSRIRGSNACNNLEDLEKLNKKNGLMLFNSIHNIQSIQLYLTSV